MHFRDDGSVVRLDGSGGVDVKTRAGSHLTAPRGTLNFDTANHPHDGLLEGGAHMESHRKDEDSSRQIEGSAPRARLAFDSEGELRMAHLENGVSFSSRQESKSAKGIQIDVHRSWKSQTADVAFAAATESPESGKTVGQQKDAQGQGKIEPRTIHGTGGVVITSETIGTEKTAGLATLAADTVDATLAAGSVLSTLDGNGHASFDQRTAQGVHQSSNSDQLQVRFVDKPASSLSAANSQSKASAAGSEIESVVQLGHVVLDQQPAKAAPGRPDEPPVHATAARLDYEGGSQNFHLTGVAGTPPRVQNGALDISATRIDFNHATGDAFARGDVKASWSGKPSEAAKTGQPGQPSQPRLGTQLPGNTLLNTGGPSDNNSPIHAIAAEAELRQSSDEVVFRSNGAASARLWQGANSVTAPTITLDRKKQTLTAESSTAANPVRTVLVTSPPARPAAKPDANGLPGKAKPAGPSIVRVRSGLLHYSEGERLATFQSGPAGSVSVETTEASNASTTEATIQAGQAVVQLLGPGIHAAPKNSTGETAVTPSSGSRIDRMTATGHVSVNWPGRSGTGEKLVYLNDDNSFTLTGTGAAPPRITDQTHGTVTGSALIFHSRDDSVTVEGDGGKTVTETQSPK